MLISLSARSYQGMKSNMVLENVYFNPPDLCIECIVSYERELLWGFSRHDA